MPCPPPGKVASGRVPLLTEGVMRSRLASAYARVFSRLAARRLSPGPCAFVTVGRVTGRIFQAPGGFLVVMLMGRASLLRSCRGHAGHARAGLFRGGS